MELKLRPHQAAAIELLRAGFAAGNMRQMFVCPTGGGKTELAIAMMSAAMIKGKRAAMILDRITLCDQTSERLSKYDIDHGVLQSGHWRYKPSEKIQVCSAQTLEKRGTFPAMDLLIVDEAHCTRATTAELIKNHPNLRVVGLSATPFTKGLADIYDGIVQTVTTAELIKQGLLAPLRVYVATEIDMTGAKKTAGEWQAGEAIERGVKISGDIVSEWHKKTMEHFQKPEKTIVFAAGVNHANDLAEKFQAAGFNFLALSYKDDDDFTQQAIKEFSKPDSHIHGLISTDKLTKGFDVPDIKIGISARPFTKSLSSHIQQMGRVMRACEGKDYALWLDHCIASGQRVLTHRGLVPIELILISDRIWDGHAFVSHKGVVSRGTRPIIKYAGLTATADHLVKTTDEGWCSLGYCADKQKTIVTTGAGRTALFERDGYFTRGCVVGTASSAVYARALRVRYVWLSLNRFVGQFAKWKNKRMPPMQPAEACTRMAECANGCNEGALQEQEQQAVRKLRWKGHSVQVRFGDFLRSLDTRELGVLAFSQGFGAGQNRQQRELRAWQHSLGDKKGKHKQPKVVKMDTYDAPIQNRKPSSQVCGLIVALTAKCRSFFSRNCDSLGKSVSQTERRVWDILDCGPRNSFTCEGLLVHNSGNYLRFMDDWDDVRENGVAELSKTSKDVAKKEPSDEEKKKAKCPKCGALWPRNADSCPSCGYVHKGRNSVEVVPAELQAIGEKSTAGKDEKQRFYSELLWYVDTTRIEKKAGWVAHKYKEKFGVWPKGLNETMIPTSLEVSNFIRSRQIAYKHSNKNMRFN